MVGGFHEAINAVMRLVGACAGLFCGGYGFGQVGADRGVKVGDRLVVLKVAKRKLMHPFGKQKAPLGDVVQQVGIGLAIGFTVRVVFAAVVLAGDVVGFQMGLNFAAFFDPTMNTQSSAVARFFGQMVSLLFVVMSGHLMVLMAINRSFYAFPVDQNFLEALGHMQLFRFGSEIFSSALWIALPMIGMLMFVNLALGIISRIAPQMNIFAVGFPITLVVGLIGIAVTLPMLDQPFMALMEKVIEIFAVT